MSVGIGLVAGQRLLELVSKGAWLQVELHLAGFELVHVQQIVDQVAEALAVVLGDAQHGAHTLRYRAEGSAVDQAERAGDGGERGAQLVADGGDELALEALDAFGLALIHGGAGDAQRVATGVALDVAAQ